MNTRKLLSVLLAAALLLCMGMTAASADYTPGTYTSEFAGMHGPLTVEVTVDENSILDAKGTEMMETPGMGDVAADHITSQVVEYQSLDVDLLSGATVTSAIVKSAVASLLEEAGADMDALNAPRERA